MNLIDEARGRIETDRLAIKLQGLVGLPGEEIGGGQQCIGVRIIRIQPDRLLGLLYRAVVIGMPVKIDESQDEMGLRQTGIERYRLLRQFQGLGGELTPLPVPTAAEIVDIGQGQAGVGQSEAGILSRAR